MSEIERGASRMESEMQKLVELLRQRNRIAREITRLINRPAQIGHIKAIDGRFTNGPLAGRTVNVKWYGKCEGLLDITPAALPDYYLVMTGPRGACATSRGEARLWAVESVFLFAAGPLVDQLTTRGVRLGIATSVRRELWDSAELHPGDHSPLWTITPEQHELLDAFSPRALEALAEDAIS